MPENMHNTYVCKSEGQTNTVEASDAIAGKTANSETVSSEAVNKGTAGSKTASSELVQALEIWWHEHARDLPWRFGRTTPWGVLVSEVMSQQTQMSRVVPYWIDWMRAWPDAKSLAQASTAEVITAWGRLGYPRRALRLQECAKVVAEQYGGELPTTYEELIALPAVGDYTANAVLSFAYGKRVAVIDTNIRRVLSRVFLGVESRGGNTTKAERELAQQVLPQSDLQSVLWNQAIMELGATVCMAQQVSCQTCPLQAYCKFYEAGLPELGVKRTRPRQRFKGTNRQVRGIILHALRQNGTIEPENIASLWNDSIQLAQCIHSLDEDGLIDIAEDGTLRLPVR